MAISTRTKKRLDDALEITPNLGDTPYADAVMDRLREAELFDSVPIGAPTEGGGVLISASRLRYELEAAFLAGQASTL